MQSGGNIISRQCPRFNNKVLAIIYFAGVEATSSPSWIKLSMEKEKRKSGLSILRANLVSIVERNSIDLRLKFSAHKKQVQTHNGDVPLKRIMFQGPDIKIFAQEKNGHPNR